MCRGLIFILPRRTALAAPPDAALVKIYRTNVS